MHVLVNLLAREERRHVFKGPRLERAVRAAERRRFRRDDLLLREIQLADRGLVVGERRHEPRFERGVVGYVRVTEAICLRQLAEIGVGEARRVIRADEPAFEEAVLGGAYAGVALVVEDENLDWQPVAADRQ